MIFSARCRAAVCGTLHALLLLSATPANPQTTASSADVIFDTDIGNDIDDALALAILHALQSRHQARILAVTITKDNPLAAPFIDAIDTFYDRADIPIGAVVKGKTPEASDYLKAVVGARKGNGSVVYPHRLKDGRQATEAVSLLRQTLSRRPDGSVTIIQVGFSTNMARLLEKDRDLVARKVKLLVLMGGNFTGGPIEYNIQKDIPAAQALFRHWPTAIVASGYEVGDTIKYPADSILRDYAYVDRHPIAEAYRHYKKMPYDRSTWDLTAAFYAVRPNRGYFSLSPPGTIHVDDKGRTSFKPTADGRHRYLIVDDKQRARIAEAFVELSSQPPDDIRKRAPANQAP